MSTNMDYLIRSSSVFFLPSFVTYTYSTSFEVRNNCPYTIWAASTPIGGGRRLDSGQTWVIDAPRGTKMARIWGRTNCNFDGAGRGSCQTGDCGGVLQCTGWGKSPNTLAEYALNQFSNLDFWDISLIEGFNIPMTFAPTNPSGGKCHAVQCTANINGECPNQLKVPGGCNNPCTIGQCGPNDLSRFFKQRCPDAYSYPQDDPTSLFACPSDSTNYRVVFC
ncbi:hypothetical protein AABB24_018629 [Solanum stoloniferum]|uniref:Osmotin-like protein n=1 Tax=Solanum stoloniferum TaxID=62892 RepID=A0ABD2TCQ0_9SOLN